MQAAEMQENVGIIIEDIRTGVTKMANWKAAGSDLVQGKWTDLREYNLDCKKTYKTEFIKEISKSEWSWKYSFDTKDTQASNNVEES